MTFPEGDLEMDIPDVVGGGKFADASHGLNRSLPRYPVNRVGAGTRNTGTAS